MLADRPRSFVDDGTALVVDLHGCSVGGGLYIVKRSLQEAYRRGRMKVEIIHGMSTSDSLPHARTIKNEFRRRLDAGEYAQWVSGHTESASGGSTSLWIRLGSSPDPKRIRINEIIPPNA